MRSEKFPIFIKKFSWTTVCCLASPSLFAASLTVDVPGDANVAIAGTITGMNGDLRGVLNYINQNPGSHTVLFNLPGVGDNVITLNALLPIVNLNAPNTVSMDGANGGTQIVVDGNSSTYRGFFARQGTITVQNLTIQNVNATGGSGGTSPGGAGGGGMGAGAALFIDEAAVALSNVTLNNATATGGAGGVSSLGDFPGGGGGGGGMGGTGGNSGPIASSTFGAGSGGGGGLGGAGGVGGSNRGAGGGGGINTGTNFTGTGGAGPSTMDPSTGFPGTQGGGIGGGAGGASASCIGVPVLGGASGGGGGGGSNNGCPGANAGAGGGVSGGSAVAYLPGVGGYGGGGGGGEASSTGFGGAIGGFGGGGGGGMQGDGIGGEGGFGGGGGGCGSFDPSSMGGKGGFGGGGGGSYSPGFATVAGGIGGGAGQVGGGGGAGFGGAIFINSAGSLTIQGAFASGTNSTIGGAAGTNATQGWNAGNHAFLVTGSTLTYDPNGSTITVSSTIADDSLASFVGAPAGVTPGTDTGGTLIVGSGANPAGVMNLTGANTYSGGTSFVKGTLNVGNNTALGAGTLTFSTTSGNILQPSVAGISLANAVALSVPGILNTNGNSFALTGDISGLGSLTKQGAQTLSLSGSLSDYSGGTLFQQGTLGVGTNVALGTGGVTFQTNSGNILQAQATIALSNPITLSTNGVFDSNGFTLTLDGAINGAGSLTKTGAGTLALSVSNSYGGGTQLNQGTLRVGNNTSLNTAALVFGTNNGNILQSGAAALNIANAITLNTDGSIDSNGNTFTLSGAISGVGSLTKIGSGTLVLPSSNSYGGVTNLNQDTLRVGNNTSLSSAALVFDINNDNILQSGAAALNIANPITLNTDGSIDSNGNTFTLSGAISGVGSLTKIGTGTLVLSNSNSYGGMTNLNEGTLRVGSNTSLSAADLNFNQNNGNILQSGAAGLNIANNITLNADGSIDSNGNTFTLSGNIIGETTALTKLGTGTVIFSGTNEYDGGTIVSAGILQINSVVSILSGSNVNTSASGAQFDIGSAGGGITLGNLTGVAGSSVTLGANNLTFGTATPSVSYSGNISGASGSLTKQGSGTVVLSGTNTYTGTTTVSAGVLQINSTASIPSGGNVNTSASGAQLNLVSAGGAITLGNLNGVAGSSVSLGANNLIFGTATPSTTYAGNITGTTASLTKQGSGTAILSGSNAYTGGTVISAGTLQINSTASIPSGGNVNTSASGAQLSIASAGGTVIVGDLTGVAGSLVALGGNTLTVGTTTPSVSYPGNISGASGSLTKQGSGTVVLSGTNTYTGTTTVSAGVLKINSTASIPSGGNVNISASGAQLNLSSAGGAVTIGDLTGVSGGSVSLGTNALTLGTTNPSATYSGAILGTTASVTKVGSGGEFLMGASTYAGGTNFNQGTLGVGDPASLGTGTLTFGVNNDNLLQAQSTITMANAILLNTNGDIDAGGNTFTLSGVISGNGVLTKTGFGTVILTNANLYTGGTSLEQETLGIGNATALGTGALTFGVNSGNILQAEATVAIANAVVFNMDGTIDSNGFGLTLSGSISGGNTLTKIGAGTLSLPNANLYSGGTNLNQGTLQIGNSGSLGTGVLTFGGMNGNIFYAPLNTTLTNAIAFNNSGVINPDVNTLVLSGNISGGSTLVKEGSGILALSGTNTYGSTAINDGTLRIDAPAALPTAGSVTTGTALLLFNFAGTGTYSGNISGDGALHIENGGTVNLQGNNTYAGGTVINAATTLTSQSTSALPSNGTAVINGDLILDFSGTQNYTGTLLGSGKITVNNPNTEFEISQSNNLFLGDMEVVSGILNVDASMTGLTSTVVDSGGTLSGIGTLGGNLLLQGTISPGNSIGTINVTDVTFDTGSNYLLEVSNAAADQVIASGTVTINPGATVSLAGLGLSSPLQSYTIITSGTPLVGSGNFTLINSLPRFNFSLGYNTNNVFLLLDSVNPVNPFVATGNAAGVAKAFNVMVETNPNAPGLSDVLAVLQLQTEAEWQDSFNQMQPANLDDIAFAEENVAERVRQGFSTRLFQQRVEACPDQDPWRIWIVPFIEHVHQRGNKNARGYKENFRGFSTGFDYQFERHWAITTGFTFADSDVSIVKGKAHGSFKTYAGTIGAIWSDSHFFVDGLFSYLYNDVDAKRRMRFSATGAPTVEYKARHDQNSNEFMGHFGTGYDFKIAAGEHGTVNIYPFVDVDYMFLTQNGYTEHGAQALDLKVYQKDYDLLRPEGGIGFGYTGCFHNANVNFDVTTSYIREQRFLGKKTKARFEDGPKKFTVRGLNPRNNLLGVGARLTYAMPRETNASISIGYHGEFGAHFVENAAEAEVRFAF